MVALSVLDEFASMRRQKVLILIFYFHVLELFSAKCCNFSIQLCNDEFLTARFRLSYNVDTKVQ